MLHGVSNTHSRDANADSHTKGVVFVCIHNAGRSQMAAGFMRNLAGGRFVVESAGSAPGDAVNPQAVAAIRELGIDISPYVPQHIDQVDMSQISVAVTMGCGDACPYIPGVKYIDWQLDDPRGQELDAVRQIRDRIQFLVEDLYRVL